MNIYECIKFLKDYFIIKKRRAFFAIVCIIISTCAVFFQPMIIRNITDYGLINKDIRIIGKYVIILLIIVIVGQISNYLLSLNFIDIRNESEYNIYKKTIKKLINLKYIYYTDKNSSEIINMLTTDISSILSIIDRNNITLISYLFQFISGISGLLLVDYRLTIIVLFAIPVKYFFVKKIAFIQESNIKKYLLLLSNFSGWISELISGIKEIKFWQKHVVYTNFNKKETELLKTKKIYNNIISLNIFIQSLIEWLIIAVIYFFGGVLVVLEGLSIGSLIAFISYSNYVIGPVSAFLNIRLTFANIKPSINRFNEFMNLEEEICGNDEPEDIGNIKFENVSFSYDSSRKILDNITFEIPLNKKIAIIGNNGAGKSTLLNLILRLIEPDEGIIKLNNKNIKDYNLDEYRKLFSFVSQDIYVFNKTIKENINFENIECDDNLDKIYKKSGVEDFLSTMEDGDNTVVGENGAKLSGGERQKIAVARALFRNTQFIIFDEPTNNLDKNSDLYFQNLIIKEMKNKTIILVTHNYDSLKEMDIVYKIEDGKVRVYEKIM